MFWSDATSDRRSRRQSAGDRDRQRRSAVGIAAVDHQLHLVGQLRGKRVDQRGRGARRPPGNGRRPRRCATRLEQRVDARRRAVVKLDPQRRRPRLAFDPLRSICDQDAVGDAKPRPFDGAFGAGERGGCCLRRSGPERPKYNFLKTSVPQRVHGLNPLCDRTEHDRLNAQFGQKSDDFGSKTDQVARHSAVFVH